MSLNKDLSTLVANPESRLFISACGAIKLIYNSSSFYDKVLICCDGNSFREVEVTGFGVTGNCHHLTIKDPLCPERPVEIWGEGDTVLFAGSKIARKRFVYPSNPHEGLPSITAYGAQFVLDLDAVNKYQLTADDIAHEPINLRRCQDHLVFGGVVLKSVAILEPVIYQPLPTVSE